MAGIQLGKKETCILEALQPYADKASIEIRHIEIVGAKKAPTIRIYIDSPEGVDFDTLSSSQEWINEVMDKLDPFPGAYMLEVSSPGIDSPCRLDTHFIAAIGEKITIKLSEKLNGRSVFTGVLKDANNEEVCVEIDGTAYTLAYSLMKSAHIIGNVVFK